MKACQFSLAGHATPPSTPPKPAGHLGGPTSPVPSPVSRVKTPVNQLKSPLFRSSPNAAIRSPVFAQAFVKDVSVASSLEGLAAWVSANYMGMGKSAADALPELRRKGITASGNSFTMNGQIMSATEIAQALRLQVRPGSRPTSPPLPASMTPQVSLSPSTPVAASSRESGLEGLAAWISANYMGMGKSAADALPELRRKGIAASGNSFIMGGRRMDAAGIASALRLQVRPGGRPDSPVPSSPRQASAGRAVPFFGSTPPAFGGSSTSPPRGASSPSQAGLSSSMQAQAQGLRWLAAWIASTHTGMGKTEMDVLPELRRRGIVCSSVKGGKHFFRVPGHGSALDAAAVAQALRLQARSDASSSGSASRAVSPNFPPPTPPNSPQVQAPSRMSSAGDSLEHLAAFISASYMGMGKSAADALPELRRKGIVGVGPDMFSWGGSILTADEVAQALRLQPRTPSRPSTPASFRPASPAAPAPSAASYSALSASASSASGLEGLAAWISTNYMGMGKSAADALPELRRKGITASGSSFMMGGQRMDAAGIASALRLQARTPSRTASWGPSRLASPAGPAASFSAPATPAGSASGLEGLAAWVSANYMGMGKSAADALPELRRKGITASGSSFMMGGQRMDAAGIASALRLQPRAPGRPSTPTSFRSASPAAPAPSAASYSAPATSIDSASGLEGLAAWISANYMGMGKSAADALPELRRKGITASGSSFMMGGQMMDAAGIASALRLQARTPSRFSSPVPSRPPTSPATLATSYSAPAASSSSTSGLEGLAAWVSANYMGMGKSAADALPELRRKGITASGSSFMMGGQRMDAAGIASALRLQPRAPGPPSTPTSFRSASPAAPAPSAASYSAPATSIDSASGLEGLAAWISANYMGMGKSAADALPELRRKGITASGSSFMMGGQRMDAAGIASALRLQARTPSRQSTPTSSRALASSPAPAVSYSAPAARPFSPAAPSASASSASGLEGLAAWISANYMGMGKSAADALPELRRKGVTASGNGYAIAGQTTDAAGIAQALRLQARAPSRTPAPAPARPSSSPTRAAQPSATTPSASSSAHVKPSRPAGSWDWAVRMTPERAMGGTRWLAAWLSANYIGIGKREADALPELRRRGVVCSAIRGGQHWFEVPGQTRDLSAEEVAALLKLRKR